MTVSINNVALNNQPILLKENLLQIQTDQMSINGSMARNKIGQKKMADMQFTILSPADYQTLIANFTTGSGVYYSNNASDYSGGLLTFSGLPTFSESEYVQGGSLYRSFQVSLREI